MSTEPPEGTKELTVASAMTKAPASVRPETPLSEALSLMTSRRVRHVPVVDAEGRVVGIVSDRDVSGAPKESPHLRLMRVSDVMSPGVVTIFAEMSLAEAARALTSHRIGALPVVDHEGRLVGIISHVDVMNALLPSR